MRIAFATVALVAGGTACSFDSAPPVDASIACDDDGDCPAEQACNLVRLRCVPAGSDTTAPTVVSVAFSPAAVHSGLAALVIEADEPLGSTVLVAPTPGSPALPFSPAAIVGATASLAVDTTDLAEGTYGVGSVEVQDVAGNRGARKDNDAWLVVDRTEPRLVNPAIVEVPATGLSDLDGGNVLVVQFFASERLATDGGATIALAGATAACTTDDAQRARCELTIATGAALDGENTVTIAARDDAGNEVTGALSAFVDVAAPSIVADSVALAITAPTGAAASEAGASARIEVTFIVSEPLGAMPVVLVETDGAPLPFVVTAIGNRYTGTATVPPGAPVGTWPVRVELVDRVGHVNAQALPLPAPHEAGVPFGAATTSACTPPAISVVCMDADADGFFAPGTCAGTDCNDLDPTVFPGAPELPGDGVANDCSTDDDAAIDESVGYFVDCSADVGGEGSRAAPARSLVKAKELLLGDARPYLFLRGAGECATEAFFPAVTIVGGLVVQPDGSWVRGGVNDRTRVVGTEGLNLDDGRALDGIVADFDDLGAAIDVLGPSVITRVTVPERRLNVFNPVVISDSSTATLDVRDTGSAHVSSTDIGHLLVDGTASVHRGTIGLVSVSGRLDVASAVIVAPDLFLSEPVVECRDCAHLGLFHTTVVRTFHSNSALIGGRALGDVLVLASSLVERRAAALFFDFEVSADTTIELAANNYGRLENTDPPPDVAVIDFSTFTAASIDELGALPELSSYGTSTFDPIPFDDFVHPAAVSPLRTSGLVQLGYIGAPSFVMIDIDGECRYDDGNPDIGADEL